MAKIGILKSLSWGEIEREPRYIAASEFEKEYRPSDDINAAWAFEEAKNILGKTDAAVMTVDRKAKEVLAFLAPGSGLFGIILMVLTSEKVGFRFPTFALAILGMIFLVGAMLYAFTVLTPHGQTVGIRISGTLRLAEKHKQNKAQAYYTAELGKSIAVLGITTEYKGKCLKRSYGYLILGMTSLVLSILSAAYFFLRISLSA